MDRDQLDSAIREANVKGTRDQLVATLQALPDEVLFRSLFALASDKQTNAPACDAANMLLELNPTCPLPCADVVRNIAKSNWFISLEELPWYVVKQFGLPAVLDAVEAVRQESLTEIESKMLGTVEYWAKLAPTA